MIQSPVAGFNKHSEQQATMAEHRQLAASVAQAVQERFASLPKTGKNQPHEHTVLAGIVAYTDSQNQLSDNSSLGNNNSSNSRQPMHVVAIGTGTKCLGGSKRSAAGDVINDSHAEVVTRRAFVAWVYRQLMLAAKQHPKKAEQSQQQCVQDKAEQEPQAELPRSTDPCDALCAPAFYWCPDSCKFRLHPGVKFAMYVSQPPCGDASIYGPTAGPRPDSEAACLLDNQQQAGSVMQQHQQQQLLQAAAGRTGAKLIRLSGVADVGEAAALATAPEGAATQQQQQQQQQHCREVCIPCASDVEAGPQQLGALRRKPGKGDPTLSLSCSDKIARWSCLGLQGCLLSSCLAEPLHLQLLAVSVPGTAAGSAANEALAPVAAAAAAASDASGVARTGKGAAEACSAVGKNSAAAAPAVQAAAGSEQCQQQQQAAAAVIQAVEAAGRRAVSSRLADCAVLLQQPFVLLAPVVVAVQPPDSKLGLIPDAIRKSPSGVSINWSCSLPLLTALTRPPAKPSTAAAAGVHEVTLAAYGRKAGAGRKGPNWDSKKTRSRLCSAAMFSEQWQALLAAMPKLKQGFCAAATADAAIKSCHSAETAAARAAAETAAARAAAESNVQQLEGAGMAVDMTAYRTEKQRVGRQYQQAWAELRQASSVFAGWIVKP